MKWKESKLRDAKYPFSGFSKKLGKNYHINLHNGWFGSVSIVSYTGH